MGIPINVNGSKKFLPKQLTDTLPTLGALLQGCYTDLP